MEKLTARGCGAVAVFDSGIGGLNLLCRCARLVPGAEYYYISDSDNVPYGNRSRQEILSLTLAALKDIESLNPEALIIGCNTVTAHCINDLRKIYKFPVIGIQPAVKQAAKSGGRCLVLATEATVNSGAFSQLVKNYAPHDTEVVGCKHLAEYIERNILHLPKRLPEGLLPDIAADSVVLGCTHYAFVKRQIQQRYGCSVFDGLDGTAARFAEIVGIANHFCPPIGISVHRNNKKLKITFIGGNIDLNKQIMKYLFSNSI